MSSHAAKLDLYFVDDGGEEKKSGEIAPMGEQVRRHTGAYC